MELVLHVASYNGLPPRVAETVRVGGQACVLGRHPDSQLELPDPECLVSGRHAVISPQGDGFAVTDVSTNGTYLNDGADPIPPHQPVALSHGDRLGIGPYVVEVALENGQVGTPADPFAEAGSDDLPGMPDATAGPDIMELLGAGSGSAASSQAPVRHAPRSLESQRPSVENIHFHLPQPEPQAKPSREEGAAEPPQSPPPAAPQEQPSASPAGIPEDYDLLLDAFTEESAGPGNESEPGQALPAGPAVPEADSVPERPVEATGAGDAGAATAQRQREAAPAPEQGSQPPPAGAAASTAASGELEAFLSGLGVAPPADIENSAAVLQLSGELLRAMTQGLMTVMMARARFKSELRLEVTTIRARDNNPFQFCVDPEDALERLLWRRSRGFLDPTAAVHKTFDDIQAHEMAMIAGLRAALRALLARFNPEQLEKQFEGESHLEKLLPIARKSKCWDLFVSTFDQVADDAAEDFMRLFGEAFNRAYEEQIRRLTADRKPDPSP